LGLLGRLAARNRLVDRRFAALGYSYTVDTSDFQYTNPITGAPTGYQPPPVTAYGYSGGGALSPADAALISQGISTGGLLAAKALTPVPTVSYNAATGQYLATGGATLPGGISSPLLQSELSNYLPYILLIGGLVLVVSMAHR